MVFTPSPEKKISGCVQPPPSQGECAFMIQVFQTLFITICYDGFIPEVLWDCQGIYIMYIIL
jgi:hypothetical protein